MNCVQEKERKKKLKGVTYTELRTVRLREDRKNSLEEPWLPEFWVMVKFLVDDFYSAFF